MYRRHNFGDGRDVGSKVPQASKEHSAEYISPTLRERPHTADVVFGLDKEREAPIKLVNEVVPHSTKWAQSV